jgi:signal transduction histidine kinase
VKAAGAAAGLALENARLHAEILLQLEEVRASRARIVEAADSERIRIERDLHDGAQQRLLALSMALRETHRKIGGDGTAARASLDAALGELSSALSELRELARGVYPAILSEDGLGPALESLARRAVVPTTVNLDLPQRPADVSERTAYFVVSEGLANIAKHAQASEAVVTASILGEMLFLEVRDDGLGDADPSRGTGLRGLADRVAAVGGHLRIESSKGNGTRLIAEIPCG